MASDTENRKKTALESMQSYKEGAKLQAAPGKKATGCSECLYEVCVADRRVGPTSLQESPREQIRVPGMTRDTL